MEINRYNYEKIKTIMSRFELTLINNISPNIIN